jgi:hypothetical protein
MSMEEIRASFLGFYEKRLRLVLLRAELVGLQQIASSVVAVRDPESYSLATFDIAASSRSSRTPIHLPLACHSSSSLSHRFGTRFVSRTTKAAYSSTSSRVLS